MARRDEKFLRIRHSCRDRTPVVTRGFSTRSVEEWDRAADLSNVNPALDDPRPDVRPEGPVLQNCADHAGRHRVELRNGGTDGGGAALAVLLVPLRPDGAQAVVRYDPLEQQLHHRSRLTLAPRG